MRSAFLYVLSLVVCVGLSSASVAAPEVREWTMLVFLNGHNSLDQFGVLNINQMETVGSTDDINIVVQWASHKFSKTKRLFVTHDNDTNTVTSKTVEELPRVDMGDYRELVAFVKWGMEHYPAKHYFIDIWNHGSGWHRDQDGKLVRNISHDDITNHMITTPQLGVAMREVAEVAGKVDLLGTDACLMAMAEVGAEVEDSVVHFVGSQEVEPGAGWPYDKILSRWAEAPKSDGAAIGKILSEEYVRSYEGSGHLATMSTFDLAAGGALQKAISKLGEEITALDEDGKAAVLKAMKAATAFRVHDYKDLGDFVAHLRTQNVAGLTSGTLDAVDSAVEGFVLTNRVSGKSDRIHGVSLWLPESESVYSSYSEKYAELNFTDQTGWDEALASLF